MEEDNGGGDDEPQQDEIRRNQTLDECISDRVDTIGQHCCIDTHIRLLHTNTHTHTLYLYLNVNITFLYCS